MVTKSAEANTSIESVDIRTRLLVVSSVRLLRDGLAGILQQRLGATSVRAAPDAETALAVLAEFKPTLILLDVAADDGLAVARRISASAHGVQMLGFGARALDHDVFAYASAGITGFIPREASTDDLFHAIDRAANGELLCSPRVAATLFRRLAELAVVQRPSLQAALTSREREIVRCIDEGRTNKEIARHLCIEVSTVKNHVHNILEKLQVTRRGEAVARLRTMIDPHRSSTLDPPHI